MVRSDLIENNKAKGARTEPAFELREEENPSKKRARIIDSDDRKMVDRG
jgi:hypothetical protein